MGIIFNKKICLLYFVYRINFFINFANLKNKTFKIVSTTN